MVSKKQFQKIVLDFYRAHGRHELPWRKTTDPYRILVSEIMLQQTQVDRVIPKYIAFLERFPTVVSLAEASVAEVLTLWSGLGYNRRALNLKKAAELIFSLNKGMFPKTHKELLVLPGIGFYTASAVMAFAYNEKSNCIETNIRTVFIHHFFNKETAVADQDIQMMLEKTLPEKDFRIWYWALMDYGAYLKKTVGNISQQSKLYSKQKPFKTSDRYIRGQILKSLITSQKSINIKKLFEERKFECTFVYFKSIIIQLQKEGLVKVKRESVALPQ